ANGVQHEDPLGGGNERRVLGGDVRVGGDVTQERQAEPARLAKVIDVTGVQGIERAIHHRHPLAVASELLETDDQCRPSPSGGRSSGRRPSPRRSPTPRGRPPWAPSGPPPPSPPPRHPTPASD